MSKIKVGNVLFNVLAIVTVIAVLFVTVNLVTGTKGYAVTSDSMAETLTRGDVVFSKKVSFEELKAGDVITVRVSDAGYFTHRIVDIDADSKTVMTKGDANDANDPMPTQADMIVGRMVYSIPLLGYISIALGGKSGLVLPIILIIIAAALIAANTLIKGKQKMRGDDNE